ncbi:MAG: RraA family protein [Pseudomonadota bacterium]
MPVGFRILQRRHRVDAATIENFQALPVATISDAMSRMFAAGPRLRPMHAGGPFAGAALTVRVRPGDNLMVHKALMLAEPGDVIVVDGGADLTNALIGELMISYARIVGVAGVVVDGAIRDSGWVRKNTFPVFAAGVTHRGPYKDGPGEINVPVAIDGMVINPGDLIVGDDDGLLCIPYGETEKIYADAARKAEAEARTLADLAVGKLGSKKWVDDALARLGCEQQQATSGEG